MSDEELKRLTDRQFKGTISGMEQKRLFAFIRDQWAIPGLTDQEIGNILITGHDDYGKPDENGEVREL